MNSVIYANGSKSVVMAYHNGSGKPSAPGAEWTEMKDFKPLTGEWTASNSGEWVELNSAAQKVDRYRVAVGLYIDNKAKSLGFDSIITAVTYADEPADALNQKYGAALREWRSECWWKCREVLADWQGGGEEPTLEGLIDSLPVFEVE